MAMTKKLFGELNAPFYIYAPPYEQNSGGIRAMHYLCHALNLVGEEAYVLTGTTSEKLRTPCLTNETINRHKAAGREPVVIYPEVISGNPLAARNVVRYLLNIPGFLTKEKPQWQPSDLIYSLSLEIVPEGMKGELLELPLIDSSIYTPPEPDTESRQGTLLFINRFITRGGQLLPVTDQSLEISFRVGRRSPEELAELYRKAELMYVYEHSTACYEALLCGCPIVYIPNETMLPERTSEYLGPGGSSWGLDPADIEMAKKTVFLAQEKYNALQDQFWNQLESFIAATQALARRNRATPEFERAPCISIEQAIAFYNEKNYEAATQSLTEILEADPGNALAYTYLAFICATQGLLDDADTFIEQARELAPGRPELPAALGEVLLKTGHPEQAQKYLGMAVMQQSDFFGAYPALAEALRLNGNMNAAIDLLESGAKIPSTDQENIRQVLFSMQDKRGNIAAQAELCLRMRDGTDRQAQAIQLLADSGAPPELVYSELESWKNKQLAQGTTRRTNKIAAPRRALVVGFLVSDFGQNMDSARLEALLLHLPPKKFRTAIIDDSPTEKSTPLVQRCFLLSDHWLSTSKMDDAAANNAIAALNLDLLIDVSGFGERHRLNLLFASNAAFKASWSDTLPWHGEEVIPISGIAQLNEMRQESLPETCITLSGLGEVALLPDVAITKRTQTGNTEFGCLTPAGKISARNWHFFAQLLSEIPDSRLTINLGGLDESAIEFITTQFAAGGVPATRLLFVSATSSAALCAAWDKIDIGLAPLHGSGGEALTTALWMNTPFIALASHLPWSCRPAALLRSVGLMQLIAATPEEYLCVARNLAGTPQKFELRPSIQEDRRYTPRHLAIDFGKALTRICFGKAK